MTATDELRRLLDELRELACDINEKEIRSHSVITLNQGRYNRQSKLDINHDWLNAWHAELERILQAVEATLGRGECHDSNKRFNAWQCSECGATMLLMFDDCGEPTYSVDGVADMPRFCPNCGREVVE